jgi:hypothetical protein
MITAIMITITTVMSMITTAMTTTTTAMGEGSSGPPFRWRPEFPM